MPRTRTRKSAAADAEPAVVEQDVAEEAPSHADEETTHTQHLRFDEPLSWRAGRPIPVSDLLTRLQALFAELSEIDQDDADRESLTPKAQELAGTQLLAHKDKGVRAWSLLCIVKMFHLLAPNAPYKAAQLKDIFALFATQVIPAFADSTNPYLQQYNEILTSFAKDKSVLLVLDIPNGDNLILQIFQNAFDVMAGNGKDSTADRVSKNVEYQLTTLLADIVQEAEALPNDVIDVVLAQFLRADITVTGIDSAITSPAYDMARAVCNSCTTNMTRYVSTYFSSVLIDASEIARTVKAKPRGKKRKHDADDDDLDDTTASAPSADDFEEAEKAHKLLRELWRSSPDVVQGVVPQIEAEISAEDTQLRVMAVQAIGDMISGIGATGPQPQELLDPAAWPSQSVQSSDASAQRKSIAPYSFSKVYPECYQAFTDRCRDKSNAVRVAWVTGIGRVLATNAGGKGLDNDQETQLLQHIKDCSKDNDEKVRLATIESLSSLSYSSLIGVLSKDGGIDVKGSLLDSLAERIKDLRPPVRTAATTLLAKLWGVASGAIAQGDSSTQAVVNAVPTRILDARYLNQPDVNYSIPQAIHDLLLPISFPPIKAISTEDQTKTKNNTPDADAIRAERVLIMVASLDERAEKVFFGLQGQQTYKAKYVSAYLDRCEAAANNKKDSDAKQDLEKIISILSKDLLDAEAATANLRQFAKQNDKRNNQLIRFCLAPDSDYRKVTKAMKELNKRVEASSAPAILDTLTPLLKTAAILTYNRSHVPTFMRFARTDERGLANAANKLLKHIAQTSSEVFKVHVAELCQSLQESPPSEFSPSDSFAVHTLKTCVGFARRFPEGMPKDRAFYQALTAYALYGNPPKVAKHAVSIIVAAADKKEMLVDNILKKCLKGLKYGESHFLSRLAAIAQMQLLANDQAWAERDTITAIAVKDILGTARTSVQEHDPEWSVIEDYDEDLTAKLLAIKILINGLRGKVASEGQHDVDSLQAAVTPVYRLLNTLIEREGELTTKTVTPKHHRAQLRLAAGVSLLKLCCDRTLDKFLSAADFNRLARLCQDPLPEVRAGFAKCLRKYLGRGKLPSRFFALAFLYAFEPNKDTKQSMETWIKARTAATAKTDETIDPILEAVFPRLLSLLVHHSDFSEDVNDLQDTVHYIVFYLINVATESSLPVLYSIAQRLRSVQDGIDPSKTDHLYIVSDVAEATIRAYNEEKGWVLQTITEKARFPSGLFIRLGTDVNAQDLAEKRYLPDEMVDLIPDLVKASLKTRRRKIERGAAPKKAKDTADDSVVKLRKKQASHIPARKRGADSETPEPKATKKTKSAKATDDSVRRRSSRGTAAAKTYIEMDSDEEDEELERWNDEDNKENHELTDTPPTSEPVVAEDVEMTTASPPPAKTKPTQSKSGTTKKTATTSRKPSSRASARQAQKLSEYDVSDEDA